MMREAGDGHSAARMRALVVVLWRAGLRISEALMLNETDLDPSAGSIIVRNALALWTESARSAAWPASRATKPLAGGRIADG